MRKPEVLKYMLLALAINGVLIGLLLWWGFGQVDGLKAWLQTQSAREGGFLLKSWAWIASGLKLVFVGLKWLVLILVCYFIVPTIYNILLNLNPASALLASKMFQVVFQSEAGVALPEPPFLKGLANTILGEVRKLVAMLGLMLIALLFNLIPILGSVISVVLMLIIGIQFSGWSYITPYYEALEFDYGQQRSAMRKQRMMLWGLGSVSAIPIFNLLALFIGPVGGALLAAELHKEQVG